MLQNIDDQGRRRKIGSALLCLGYVLVAIGLLSCFPMVRGVSKAGGMMAYAGVPRWQDSALLTVFGFSLPFGCAVAMAGSAVRHSRASAKLVAGIPLGFFGVVLFVAFILWFPKITFLLGMGGITNVVAICTTIYFCTYGIGAENPWPGLLRGLGYLTFAYTAWFTCGLMTSPGAGAVYSEFGRNWEVVSDLTTKIQLCWVIGWTLTACSLVLERQSVTKAARDSAPSDLLVPSPSNARVASVAEVAQAGAE